MTNNGELLFIFLYCVCVCCPIRFPTGASPLTAAMEGALVKITKGAANSVLTPASFKLVRSRHAQFAVQSSVSEVY